MKKPLKFVRGSYIMISGISKVIYINIVYLQIIVLVERINDTIRFRTLYWFYL